MLWLQEHERPPTALRVMDDLFVLAIQMLQRVGYCAARLRSGGRDHSALSCFKYKALYKYCMLLCILL